MQIAYSSINRYLILLNSALFLSYWVMMIFYYGNLPDHIPVYFDLSGEATHWRQTDLVSWFAMPLVLTGSGLHTFFIVWAVSAAGIESWNFPLKKKILSLSNENQHIYLKKVRWFSAHLLHISILTMLLIFISVGIYTYFYVTNSGVFSISAAIIFITLLYFSYIIWHYVNLKRSFEKQLGSQKFRNP